LRRIGERVYVHMTDLFLQLDLHHNTQELLDKTI
jgi:hypothetical protein